MVSRRAILGLGLGDVVAAATGIAADVVFSGPGKVVLPHFPHARPGRRVSGSFHSRARGETVGWTISYPPQHGPGDSLPVCLVLHGFDSDHRYAFSTLGLQFAQAQIVGGKPLAPVVLASIDGGNAYWHPRRNRDDPIKMLLDEFMPGLAARHLKTDAIAALGWSMGGYGALLLAELSTKVITVAAESPAIWPSSEAAVNVNASAFDSATDWRTYSVMARASKLRRVAVRVDCGLSDPFLPASQALGAVLDPPSEVHLSPGGHDATFWATSGPSQLRFVARHLN